MNPLTIQRAEKILEEREKGAQGYCVLAQLDLDGYPTAATISPAKIEGIRRITFCSGTQSNWAKRIAKCAKASVCFNSPEYNITLIGDMEMLCDLDAKKEMWYEGMGTYFTGPEDPRFCALRFTTRRYSLMLGEFDQDGSDRGEL